MFLEGYKRLEIARGGEVMSNKRVLTCVMGKGGKGGGFFGVLCMGSVGLSQSVDR